jgi:hypothetical protein
LKKTLTKTVSGVAQGVGPEFKPQYHKKMITSVFSRETKCLKILTKGTLAKNLGSA